MISHSMSVFIDRFLRSYPHVFGVEEFIEYLECLDYKISFEEAEEILSSSSSLFELEDDLYVTKSSVFTGKYFTVLLTKEEIANKCFLPGHRCVPFVDQERVVSSINFCNRDSYLSKKIVTFSKEYAIEHYILFGEGYAQYYIADDPGMRDYDFMKNDCQLPKNVNLSCVDISDIIDEYNITLGDRLLLRVIDWDECIVEISPLVRPKKDTLELSKEELNRNKWFKYFEKTMLESFDINGPCASIVDQIAKVYLSDLKKLTGPDSGSIEEFINRTKKISFELFGVDVRLWKKGFDVPAVGNWNNFEESNNEKTDVFNYKYNIPDYIIDEYIKDYAYQKKQINSDIVRDILPKTYYISPEYEENLLLNIASRNDIIFKNYNWFKDFHLGELRHNILNLYKKVNSLVYDIDRVGIKFKNFPQQELVSLSQLYADIINIIEIIASDETKKVDCEIYSNSVEGLELIFEETEKELRNALLNIKKKEFKLVE